MLKPNFMKIAGDKKGTHSMQCLIDMINLPEEEDELEECIKDHVIDLAFDGNGCHVLQKVIICLKESRLDFLLKPILDKLVEISSD